MPALCQRLDSPDRSGEHFSKSGSLTIIDDRNLKVIHELRFAAIVEPRLGSILLNPIDWHDIELIKDEGGGHIDGTDSQRWGGVPEPAPLPRCMWGVGATPV